MGAGTLPWNDVVDLLPEGAAGVDEVTIQKVDYYMASMHAFDYQIFCNHSEAYTNCVAALNIPNNVIVNVPEIILTGRPDYREQWVRTPVPQKLAILEMIYYANQNEYNSLILAVAVGVTFALGKVTGFTDAWLASRIAQVMTLNPGLNIADKVTPATLTDFQMRYVINKMDSDVLYNFLAGLYPSFSQTSLNSLNWVIEQTRSQAMTHVLSYCSSLVEFDYLPFSLMPKITPAQYEALLKAAVSFIIDPWGSTFGPAYAASTYPDLANFGVRGQMMRDKQMRKYEGKWIAGGAMSRLQIDAVLAQCSNHLEMAIESAADPIERLREMMVGVNIREIGDQIYIFDDSNQSLNLTPRAISAEFMRERQPENQEGEQESFWGVNIPNEEADREHRAAARRAWPAAARNLPINAIAISSVQAMKLTVGLFPTTPLMQAVKAISGIVLQVSKQVPLKAYGPTAANIQVLGRFNNDLYLPVNRILQTVTLTVDEIIPTYAGARNTVNYSEATMVTGADNKRPRRPAIGVVYPRVMRGRPADLLDDEEGGADNAGIEFLLPGNN